MLKMRPLQKAMEVHAMILIGVQQQGRYGPNKEILLDHSSFEPPYCSLQYCGVCIQSLLEASSHLPTPFFIAEEEPQNTSVPS